MNKICFFKRTLGMKFAQVLSLFVLHSVASLYFTPRDTSTIAIELHKPLNSTEKTALDIQRMRFCHLLLLLLLVALFCIFIRNPESETTHLTPSSHESFHGRSFLESTTMVEKKLSFRSRKLSFHGSCTDRDISISQSRDTTSGIPQYIVQIMNTCSSGCLPSNIHLHCEWFASARVVNPRSFKRMSFDDCLVNGGKPLKSSQVIRFTYANSFMYPLTFKSATFCAA